MARVIEFLDGSCETLLRDDDPREVYMQLERILRERLGDDTADLLGLAVEESAEEELKSYEASCESYRNCLQVTQDALCTVLAMLEAKRLNQDKIAAVIKHAVQIINNEM